MMLKIVPFCSTAEAAQFPDLISLAARVRRTRTLFCAWFFLVILLGIALPAWNAKAASLDGQHDPTVTIGSAKLRNLLLFVWDHRCASCGSVYRETVIKLDPEIAAGALTVMLVQTLPSKTADDQIEIINAASLLLAPSPAYAGIVTSWLEDRVAASNVTLDAVTAEVAKALRENCSRDPQPLVNALTNKTMLARAIIVLKVRTDELNRRSPHDGLRRLILNGRPLAEWGVKEPSADSIRSLLLKR